ncbi:copine-1-like isoform X2 [Dendronephthya gigantea]|uniref:copine-1-like isoform X2 n=1 Tax=Dendronephthya gigantea TaxID=151771 RepID=UPI0010694900|nr:copine-1-like isoform X2 [Dendronephthya gigantea]
MARVSDIYGSLKKSVPASQPPRRKYDAFQHQRKLEMYIRCTELCQVDQFSKSDPLCVLFMKNMGQWCEYGRTESIPNNLNPRFCQSIGLEVGGADTLPIKLTVYDLANFTSKDLRKHDVIGSVELDLRNVLEVERPFVGELRMPGDTKARGYIYVYFKDIKDTKSKLTFQVKGAKLTKRGMFAKCNAYFEVCRKIQEGTNEEFHPVYRSQIVARSQEPRWQPADIPLHKLCDDVDNDASILLQCWHFIQDGGDELIGEAHCSINDLLKQDQKVVQLYSQQQIKSKRPKSSGSLKILQCCLERQYNVLDFIRGGCDMKFVCAIDFTLSNGRPKDNYSLHSMLSEHNEYLEALRSLGSVLSYYCVDKRHPVFGFGARLPDEDVISHCFSLNGNENSPQIHDLEEIIDAYLRRISTLTFAGPTFLAPVFRRILRDHVPVSNQSSQCYVTVLILLDGIVNDLDELLPEVRKAKELPLSIVIAGVGPGNFHSMS